MQPSFLPLMKTFTATPSDIEQRWFVVDADGMVLGRLASEVARVIRGKHKPTFTPHMDTGDNVIVINASKVVLTGNKGAQKTYFRHTGYMGHDRFTPVATMLEKHPERVIEKAVFGMLPKTTLARTQLRQKLRVYAGADHPHVAQQPTPLAVNAAPKREIGAGKAKARAAKAKAAAAKATKTPGKSK